MHESWSSFDHHGRTTEAEAMAEGPFLYHLDADPIEQGPGCWVRLTVFAWESKNLYANYYLYILRTHTY